MEMKEKSKNVNVRFYNVVIHPSDKHEPKYYFDLFDVIVFVVLSIFISPF